MKNMKIRFRYSSHKSPIVVAYQVGKIIAAAKVNEEPTNTTIIAGHGAYELQTITSVEPTNELTREQILQANISRRAATSTHANTADAIQARINAIYDGSRYTHGLEFCKKHNIENIRALTQRKANRELLAECNEAWTLAHPGDAKRLRELGIIIF